MCEPTTILTGMAIGAAMGGGMSALSGGDGGDIARGVVLGGVIGGVTGGFALPAGAGATAATQTVAGATGATTGVAGATTGVYGAIAAHGASVSYGSWAMMGASTFMGVYGQQQAARSAVEMAKYQSKVASYNTAVAQQRAGYAQHDADYALLERKRALARFTGQQRSLLAGSGVELASGTPLNLLADTEAMGQRDIQQAALTGQRNVWAARVGAQQQQFRAHEYSMRARSTGSNSFFRTGSTLLSQGGSLLKTFPVAK